MNLQLSKTDEEKSSYGWEMIDVVSVCKAPNTELVVFYFLCFS